MVVNALIIAFEVSGIFVLLLMIVPLHLGRYYDHNLNKRASILFSAAMLHLLSTIVRIISYFVESFAETEIDTTYYLVFSLVAALISVGALMVFLLSDADGRVRFAGRSEDISLTMMSCAVIPVLFALLCETLLKREGLNLYLLGFGYSVGLNAVYAAFNLRNTRELYIKEEKLSIDQSKMLTELMQPHFIFNALSSIQVLCLIDPQKAYECIGDFAGYLRGNLNALSQDELIPLETELEHIRQFVSLEQADPARAFSFSTDIRAENVRIPALTVQPIAENAIKYGALSRHDGSGTVTVSAEIIGELLKIVVEDNGVNGTALTEKQRKSIGLGIRSTKERLAAQCGGSLTITPSDKGTRAVILMPKGDATECTP